jgi:hypothetical protein
MRSPSVSAAPAAAPARTRPLLRPLALPVEHGGWGLLFEPIALGLLVAPSWGGLFIGLAYLSGFLTRQPLKLALQDLLRGKRYPRTAWCWGLAAGYTSLALFALSLAFTFAGVGALMPLAAAAPLALIQIGYDAKNKSRGLLPELGGAIALSSSAAAIALAGNQPLAAALGLSAIILARAIPSVAYVRALVTRSHKQQASARPSLSLHALAVTAVATFAPLPAVIAMALLFARAAWGLAHPPKKAKTIGWTEIAWGVVTVVLAAM